VLRGSPTSRRETTTIRLREHADIEDQLAQEFDMPAEAAAMSVALDRAAVPMEEAAK